MVQGTLKQKAMNRELKIIKKHRDYQSVQEAQTFYERKRLTELSNILFPEEEYPTGFKDALTTLMKFQNPVQMNVWHNVNVQIKDEKGELIDTTWKNMCVFSRRFVCAEMLQCIEVLKRATPNEVWDVNGAEKAGIIFSSESVKDIDILRYFNEIVYPYLEEMVGHIQGVLDALEEQICKPIRDKINADLKIMMQLPVGQDVEFIKGKQRKM